MKCRAESAEAGMRGAAQAGQLSHSVDRPHADGTTRVPYIACLGSTKPMIFSTCAGRGRGQGVGHPRDTRSVRCDMVLRTAGAARESRRTSCVRFLANGALTGGASEMPVPASSSPMPVCGVGVSVDEAVSSLPSSPISNCMGEKRGLEQLRVP